MSSTPWALFAATAGAGAIDAVGVLAVVPQTGCGTAIYDPNSNPTDEAFVKLRRIVCNCDVGAGSVLSKARGVSNLESASTIHSASNQGVHTVAAL